MCPSGEKQYRASSIDGIVLFSIGIKSYLITCLYQIRDTAPEVPIYLISDKNPRLPFVTWVDVRSVSSSYRNFSYAYEHLSSNSEVFERLCFYRWFATLELMRMRNLQKIMHLDTDVLLLGKPWELTQQVDGKFMAIGSSAGGSCCPHVILIQGSEVLSEFCDFCIEIYTDPEKLQILRDFYLRKTAASEGGGVCDMYAFGWAGGWRGQCPSRISTIELNLPERYGVAIDMSLSDENTADVRQYWKMNGQVKAMLRDRDGGVLFESRSGRLFKAMALHFQGPLKSQMHRNFNAKTMEYCWRYFRFRASEKARGWLHPLWRRVVLGSRSLLRKVGVISSNSSKVK